MGWICGNVQDSYAGGLRRPVRQEPYLVETPRLLRVANERRREEAQGE
jgi:hypothetical protein